MKQKLVHLFEAPAIYFVHGKTLPNTLMSLQSPKSAELGATSPSSGVKPQSLEANDPLSSPGTALEGSSSTSNPQQEQRGSQIDFASVQHDWAEFSDAWETNIAQPGRKALHEFFYPPRHQQPHNIDNNAGQSQREGAGGATTPRNLPSSQNRQTNPSQQTPPSEEDNEILEQERHDRQFVENFWTVYDDLIILSLFTQIGILCRLGAAYSFRYFNSVFRHDSALFTNLPLNCLSCFIMGLLCSGESLMEIISTRFTPPRLQSDLHAEAREQTTENSNDDFENLPPVSPSSTSSTTRWRGRKRRRTKRTNARASGWRPRDDDFYSELREVQLLALERRMRASPCLVLFHVRKEDVDVVEDYFNEGYRRREEGKEDDDDEEGDRALSDDGQRFDLDDHDLILEEDQGTSHSNIQSDSRIKLSSGGRATDQGGLSSENQTGTSSVGSPGGRNYAQVDGGNVVDYGNSHLQDLDQIVTHVATDVSRRVSTLNRVNLADGWDVGTAPEEKSKDLMLGLREGLCGALSSFSSWMTSMVGLFRGGQIGEAFVGLTIGVQLPIIAYRFGQHVAVYIFAWRCKRETRRDERRGYGIRLSMDEDLSDHDSDPAMSSEGGDALSPTRDPRAKGPRTVQDEDRATPSVRAIITVLMIISLVAQITSLNFYYKPEDRLLALSLLFSPLGVLTRWKLSKFNSWRPSFPIGTFACNIAACALSGTLGRFLAGNPGSGERIALVALVGGFGGTLSSVARFIVETLAGVDPILMRAEGFTYSIISLGCGILVSFVFSTSVDWADDTGGPTSGPTSGPTLGPTPGPT